MGSQSDWATMRHASETLAALDIACDARIVSAHRTPDRLVAFAKGAREAGFKVIIAGAGGAAHLPGMTAAMTALARAGRAGGVQGAVRQGFALFDRADAGRRAGRHAGDRQAGAINAALLAAAILALNDEKLPRTARRLARAPDRGRRRTAEK